MLDESKLQRGELKSLALILKKMNSHFDLPEVKEIVKLLKKSKVREAKKACWDHREVLI